MISHFSEMRFMLLSSLKGPADTYFSIFTDGFLELQCQFKLMLTQPKEDIYSMSCNQDSDSELSLK